jgi:quercetin dioxygenase-like cupin family protein
MQSTHLAELADQLLASARAERNGRSAHTLFGGREHRLRQTVIALTAGHRLAEHNSPGEATLQVLRGQAQLITATQQWTGRVGDHVIIVPERHELLAVEDTAVLLTVVSAP